MKSLLLLSVLFSSLSFAQSNLDYLDLGSIGEGAQIRAEKDIMIPPNEQYFYIAKFEAGIAEKAGSKTAIYCEVTMIEKSTKLRKISAGTVLTLEESKQFNENDYYSYNLDIAESAVSSFSCSKVVIFYEDGAEVKGTLKDIENANEDVTQEMTVLDFNNSMAGILKVLPIDGEDINAAKKSTEE